MTERQILLVAQEGDDLRGRHVVTDSNALRFATMTFTVPVRQIDVFGTRLYVAMMPGSSETDLTDLLLRPEILEMAVRR